MLNRSLSAALFACLPATAVLADITAEDVWANQRAPIEAMGGQLIAETTRDGDSLTIGDMRMEFRLPLDAGTLTFRSSGMVLKEKGDGTVEMIYPDEIFADMRLDGPEGLLGEMRLRMVQSDYTATASGDPGDVLYELALGSGTIEISELNVPAVPELRIAMTGRMSDMRSSYRITEGELLRVSAESEDGTMVIDMDMTDDIGVQTVGTQTMTGGRSRFELVLPTGQLSLLNLSQGLRDGLTVSLETRGAQLEVRSDNLMDGESFVTQAYGYMIDEIAYGVDASGLTASGRNSGIWFEMNADALMPVPIRAAAEAATGDLAMPLNATDGPVPARLGMSILGLTADEALWSMIDPGSQLPRDPANFSLDLSAEIELLMDLLDINALMALDASAEVPVRLHSLRLERLALDLLGAALAGQGGFSFDNTDMETFDGLPAPDGAVDLRLTGVNRLLDTLVGMGLLPEEDAMGARMMMGVFATPGPGEDELTSVIEVRPDGQVLANGQRLR